jgi:hypothetical protein
MLGKKKIALLAVVLMATLTVGVYAGLQLSNNLTATWTVTNTGTELTLSWNPSPDGSTFARGSWYGNYGVRLQNTGTATYNVTVKFKIDAGAGMPEKSIVLQYWTGVWNTLPMTGWGSSELTGSFGPPSGFLVGPGYDVTTLLQIMFEGNASLTGYSTNIWVTQM